MFECELILPYFLNRVVDKWSIMLSAIIIMITMPIQTKKYTIINKVGSIYSFFGHPNRQNPLICQTTVV